MLTGPRGFICKMTGEPCCDGDCKKDRVCMLELDERAVGQQEIERREAELKEIEKLAMNLAREMVRNAIKARGLEADDWPASRVSQAAKALLDSQGNDGKIISTARHLVEAEGLPPAKSG
jgi:hypothetical protein